MVMIVVGWILWSLTALVALSHLLLPTADGGVREVKAWIGTLLLVSCLVTAFAPLSKLHLLWMFPACILVPVIVLRLVLGGRTVRFNRAVEESRRTGGDLREILTRDLPDSDWSQTDSAEGRSS